MLDKGFSEYVLRREVLSDEVDDIVMYLVVTCAHNTSIAAADRMIHRKFLQATTAFSLKVGG